MSTEMNRFESNFGLEIEEKEYCTSSFYVASLLWWWFCCFFPFRYFFMCALYYSEQVGAIANSISISISDIVVVLALAKMELISWLYPNWICIQDEYKISIYLASKATVDMYIKGTNTLLAYYIQIELLPVIITFCVNSFNAKISSHNYVLNLFNAKIERQI